MAQTPHNTFANVSASTTDSILVAADTSFRSIKVVFVAMVAGATATNVTFNTYPTGGPGVAISCTFANGANGGAVLPYNDYGWFSTTGGAGLSVTTGSGSTVGMQIGYILQ